MNVFDIDNASGKERLVLVLGPDELVDPVVWGMISHNVITGVAPVERVGVDGSTRLSYDVTGTVPLQTVLDRTLSREETLHLVVSYVDALTEADQYMIDPSWFVLDPASVRLDPATLDVRLLCLPVEGRGSGAPLLLLKHLVLNLRHDRSESADYLGELVAILNDPASTDLARLARSVRSLRLGSRVGAAVASAAPTHFVAPEQAHTEEAPAHYGAAQPAPELAALAPDEKPMSFLYLLQHYTKENKEAYARGRRASAQASAAATAPGAGPVPTPGAGPVPTPGAVRVPRPGPVPAPPPSETAYATGAPQVPAMPYDAHAAGGLTRSFGETIHVGDLAAVRAAQESRPSVPTPQGGVPGAPTLRASLFVLSSEERVWIEGPLFRIGRRRARVDLAVSGDTVSKIHATIHRESSDTWAIIDNSSTNGVEVDGARIEPMVPCRLAPGARIKIGDETLVLEIFSSP